jgi:hypothetical protein
VKSDLTASLTRGGQHVRIDDLRDIGSGGLELARRVAESTAYRIADKSVIERIMREYGFVDFDERYEKVGGFWSAEEELTERTLGFLDRVVRAIAKADRIVIVGRGGFAPRRASRTRPRATLALSATTNTLRTRSPPHGWTGVDAGTAARA